MAHSSFFLAGYLQYNLSVAAKSAAGIDVPKLTAVPCNHFLPGSACAHLSMVAQAGASQEAPGSVVTGYVNPVWATTQEVDVSRGSFSQLTTEAAIWLLSFLVCTRSTSVHIRGCNMYDTTPLTSEEVLDHCRALAFAIIELDHPLAKELLMYILWERLNQLNETMKAEANHESLCN